MLFESVAYAMGGAPAADGQQGNPIMALMPLILMFVIFYFLLIRPQQKKAKLHKEMLGSLKKGDKIITSGGIYGRINEVDGDILRVDVGNNMTLEVHRNYVSAQTDRAPKSSGKK